MTSNIRLTIVCLTLLTCAAACRVAQQTPPPPLATPNANDVLAGAKLFSQHCAVCHGPDASGSQRGPNLHTPSVLSMSDSGLVQFLADGNLRKGMPSWSRLPEERRQQLVRFLKTQPGQDLPHAP